MPVNSGSEGAPLFDAEGKVVGMVNMRVGDTYIYSGNAPFRHCVCNAIRNAERGSDGSGRRHRIRTVRSRRGAAALQMPMNCCAGRQPTRFRSMLMEESPDYLIVDNTAEIVFRKQRETPEARLAGDRVAEANLDRIVKIIAYAQGRVGRDFVGRFRFFD